MNTYWKIAIAIIMLAITVLLAALVLARPVQRTIFKVQEPAGFEQLLAGDFTAIDGVHGMWLEAENDLLVVDHCPDLEPRQLLRLLSARTSGAETLSSKRLHAVQVPAFSAAAAGPGARRDCQPDRKCATSASWRELLARWRGGN
jgi:hypothetical protein